jgi:hypothetical protein
MQRHLLPFTAAAAVLLSATLACHLARGQVTMFGFDHTPIGDATLTANPGGTLTVANLGSSGQDGVSIDISSIPYDKYLWVAELESLGPGAVHSEGSFVQSTGYGTVGGVPDQPMVIGRAQTDAAGVELSVDFSPVSIEPLRIEYYLGGPQGTLVAVETVPTSSFSGMRAAAIPSFYSKDTESHWITEDFAWSSPEALLTPGGAIVIADYFDVFASSTAMDRYTRLALVAGGDISSFTITNETVTQIPEPGTFFVLGIGTFAVAVCHRRSRKEKGSN